MQVTRISNIEDFSALRNKWQWPLDRSQPNHVFMTWEWLFTWWKHFGANRELFILVIEDRSEVIGILPLALLVRNFEYGAKVRYLQFIGYRSQQRWNDWMDVIASRKEEVLRAALEYLQEQQHLWDFLELCDIPEGSETIAALFGLTKEFGFSFETKRCRTSPYLSTCSDWQTYYNTHPPRRMKSDLERQIRRLEHQGELKFQQSPAEDVLNNLNILFDLKTRRQDALNQSPMFSQDTFRNFYRDLAKLFPSQWLDCSVLTLKGKPLAIHFGFRYNGKLYYTTPSFDPEYSPLSPGKVLLRFMIENSFADDEVRDFDFLVGQEPYKYEWATGERHSSSLSIGSSYVSGWRGRIFRRTPTYARRLLMNVTEICKLNERPNTTRG